MFVPHDTQSPYVGIARYNPSYQFPLPSSNGVSGIGGMSTSTLLLGAAVIAGAWWFFKKHRR